MRKCFIVARLLTIYTRNARCMDSTYPLHTNDQPASFDKLALHTSGSYASEALPVPFSRLCSTALAPGSPHELCTDCATLTPRRLYWHIIQLQPGQPHEIVANHTLHPRYRRGSMTDPRRGIHFHRITSSPAHPPSVAFESTNVNDGTVQIAERQRLSFSTASYERPENVIFQTPRCSEKGCVFPASPGSSQCSYHMHQQEEPVLFCSHQPTSLLLDPARMAPAEKEYDGSRNRDRRRMAAIWEQFQSDGTP